MNRTYRVGDFLYEHERGLLGQGNEQKKLEPQVNALLALLIDHPSEILSREFINARIWSGRVVSDDALRATVRKLREALGDDARNPSYIRTEPLRGYSLIAAVSQQQQSVGFARRLSLRFTLVTAVCTGAILAIAASVLIGDRASNSPLALIEPLTRMNGSEVSPDYHPAKSRLIFSHRANKDDFLQLYVKNLETQRVQRLTWEPANYANALWAPSGQELVYTRSAGELLEHYIARFDPELGIVNARQLLPGDDSKRYLAGWSNSERAIYFKDAAVAGSPAGISKLNLDSGQWLTITAPSVRGHGDFFVRESADGKMLAILREVERGKLELLVLDVATKSLLHALILPKAANQLTWAPDNRSLTLTSFSGTAQRFDLDSNHIAELNIAGAGVNDVFHQCGNDCFYMRQHNGNFLDLQEQPNPFVPQPLMASRVLDLPGAEDFPVFSNQDNEIFYISQDHSQVSIVRQAKDGQATPVLRFPLSTRIDSLQAPPGGNYLAGMIDDRVFLIDINQRSLEYLSGDIDIAGYPTWTRDGTSLLFSRTEKGIPVLYRYDVKNRTEAEVAREYITARQIDSSRSIRIDVHNNAWLFHGEEKLSMITRVSSPSPNRWKVVNGWLYHSSRKENTAYISRVNLETGEAEIREIAKNRFRLNFDLDENGKRGLFVKSLLAESNLVKVSIED